MVPKTGGVALRLLDKIDYVGGDVAAECAPSARTSISHIKQTLIATKRT